MSTNEPVHGEPEVLDQGTTATGPRGPRRTGLLVAAAVAVVAAVGAGGWAVAQLRSTGTLPTSALPADTVAFVGLDLDPSAAQKLEAVSILRKFPGLRDQLGQTGGDLRERLFEELTGGGGCPGLDFASDIAPWLGDRVAVAGVPDGRRSAASVVVVQVRDQAAARQGVRKLAGCGSPPAESPGLSFIGDYAVVAQTQALARRVAADATRAPLSDVAQYQRWMQRVGDPGIVTMYASPRAGSLVQRGLRKTAGTDGAAAPQLSDLAKAFQGAAAVIRFHDGEVELEGVAASTTAAPGPRSRVGAMTTNLPATTAAVAAVRLPPRSTRSAVHGFIRGVAVGSGMPTSRLTRAFSRRTGLRLPGDLVTVLGRGVAISVDGGLDLHAVQRSKNPASVPVALQLAGDPTRIVAVVRRLTPAAGPVGRQIAVRSGQDGVVVGLNRAYTDQVLAPGGLGSTLDFTEVVPDAERADSILYLNLDTGRGLGSQLADLVSGGDPSVAANLAPLRAVGASAWQQDGLSHALVRLSTE